MDDKGIERVLRRGFAPPGEAVREGLLRRCLAALDEGQDECAELADDELDMLAAAGDAFSGLGGQDLGS